MCVDHRGLDAPVAEELLDGADVVSIFEQMGRERVAKGVAGNALGQPGGLRGPSDGPLHSRGVKVKPADPTGRGIAATGAGGKDELPPEFRGATGGFTGEGVG